jgi:hypothetical protein
VLIIIYLTLYFREELSKMEYLVLIIIYLTLYFREDLSKMEYLVLIIIYLTLYLINTKYSIFDRSSLK